MERWHYENGKETLHTVIEKVDETDWKELTGLPYYRIFLNDFTEEGKYQPAVVNVPVPGKESKAAISYPALLIPMEYFPFGLNGDWILDLIGKFPTSGYVVYQNNLYSTSWEFLEIKSNSDWYKRKSGVLRESRLVEHLYVPNDDGITFRKANPGEENKGGFFSSSYETFKVGLMLPLML